MVIRAKKNLIPWRQVLRLPIRFSGSKSPRSSHVRITQCGRAQVLATIRGARLECFINGKAVAPDPEVDEKLADGKIALVSNPVYEEWFASDQQVLGFLF
jgi:hypothetical protein